MSESSRSPRGRFETLKETLVGAEGILRDRPAVARVRIEEATGDDWGMTLKLEVIPGIGFVRLPSGRFSVSSAWKGCGVSARRLAGSAFGRWEVHLDPGLAASLSAYAESLGETPPTAGFDYDAAIERFRLLAEFISEYEETDGFAPDSTG